MSAESGTLKADCDGGLKMSDGLEKEAGNNGQRGRSRERAACGLGWLFVEGWKWKRTREGCEWEEEGFELEGEGC